jgi:hypothetical protein
MENNDDEIKGIDENLYQETLTKIKEKLNKAASEGVLLSYTDLGKILDMDPDFIHDVIGRRFSELTKKATKSWNEPPDPDFFLIGDNIKEINGNRFYLMFKRHIERKQKGSGLLGRLMGMG